MNLPNISGSKQHQIDSGTYSQPTPNPDPYAESILEKPYPNKNQESYAQGSHDSDYLYPPPKTIGSGGRERGGYPTGPPRKYVDFEQIDNDSEYVSPPPKAANPIGSNDPYEESILGGLTPKPPGGLLDFDSYNPQGGRYVGPGEGYVLPGKGYVQPGRGGGGYIRPGSGRVHRPAVPKFTGQEGDSYDYPNEVNDGNYYPTPPPYATAPPPAYPEPPYLVDSDSYQTPHYPVEPSYVTPSSYQAPYVEKPYVVPPTEASYVTPTPAPYVVPTTPAYIEPPSCEDIWAEEDKSWNHTENVGRVWIFGSHIGPSGTSRSHF